MIKKLSASIREFKKDTLLSPLFIMAEVLLEVSIPLIMADLVDRGVEAGNMDHILNRGFLLVLLALLSLFFGVLAANAAARASAGFAKNLRQDLFHNIQAFSFSNLDKYSSSSLITRITTDVTNVQQAFMMLIRMGARSPAMLVFAMIMAFQINGRLALIYLAVLPFLAGGLIFIMRNALPIFEKVFQTYDVLNRVVQENLRGIRVVKSFVREDHEIQKFSDTSETLYRYFVKAEHFLAGTMPLMQASVYSCMLLISWVGAKLILSSEMSTGQLMSMITYTMQILMSLMMLSMVLVMSTISRAPAVRITEVLDEKPSITQKENAVAQVRDGSVRFRNVSFSYTGDASSLCLWPMDLTIESGQTIGIIGGTGSGKSSLVQLIPRLYDVTDGAVLVGGTDVRDIDLKTLRVNVAMVLQRNTLFSGTVEENLRWGNPDATAEDLARACELAQADGFIRRFEHGYDTRLEQGGTNVSGGQRQRLCIARALLKKPKILILDDSTSAVDTQTEARIKEALRNEMPDTTKLIIAQRISSIQDADRILVLDNGRISGFGTHDELLVQNTVYREVYESQTKGGDFDVSA
ncbi:MAG: ABC transporter ATP-binding protein [Bacillota bacterium]|jgi:ATP-binding cassette subfamily B protein|nr:ABC transporter ATP-binding protein [Eubacteriales bacterium]MDD4285959.1 ABC transporter ATP-binding protein [Eubacteriales bacterium]MDI9492342.1 ABC transporter ATP-binding protein [Bacillota bacterium]NLV70542.1 ABC transporter ATP-binding protein [Clostridiales bacterium]